MPMLKTSTTQTQLAKTMKIANAPWNEIAARMGDDATEADVSRMIALLYAKGIDDTDELSDDEWFALVAEAVA